MKIAFWLLRFVTVGVILAGSLLGAGVAAAGVSTISVVAPSSVKTAQEFSVNIIVQPASAICGLQLSLTFEPSLLSARSVTEGNFLSQNGAPTFFNAGTIDNTAGTITGIAGVITAAGQSVASAGTFATITFTAASRTGTTPVSLFGVIAGDTTGTPLEVSLRDSRITIKKDQKASSGGGGGGGGGGGITALADFMTEDGTIVSEVTATDDEQKVMVIIPRGTVVKGAQGQKISSLRIKKTLQNYPAQDGCQMVSTAYDIQPSGTTFNPGARLIFRYADAEIPQGIPEANLYLAWWDAASGTWVEPGSTVDPLANTVTLPLTHLSIYALMAHTRPASFEIGELTLSSKVVAPDEPLGVTFRLTNTGDLPGSYTLSLALDEEVVAERTVSLSGGQSEVLEFSIAPPPEGEHRVSIGNLAATFTVKPSPLPAAFAVRDLTISPPEVTTGMPVNITFTVTNTGEMTGTYHAVLKVNGVDVQSRGITLDGGKSQEVTFSMTTEAAGRYIATIEGLQAEYEVRPPPAAPLAQVPAGVEIRDFSVSPVYDVRTARLNAVRIRYGLEGAPEVLSGTILILKVSYEGAGREEIVLPVPDSTQESTSSGIFTYIPTAGWQPGDYAFRLELYSSEGYLKGTHLEPLTISPQDTGAVFSWKVLGIIIGAFLVVAALIVALVVMRRREMLWS